VDTAGILASTRRGGAKKAEGGGKARTLNSLELLEAVKRKTIRERYGSKREKPPGF